MRPIINAIKHYFHTPAAVLTSGTSVAINIVSAIAEGATRSNAFDVYEGATVKAVYVEHWLSGVTIDKTGTWVIVKLPASVAKPTTTEMANLGTYKNKKNILNSGQGLLPTNGNVMNIYKGWIKIPKGKQRFGLGDKLQLVLSAVGTNVNHCGISTFKEYS